MAKHVWSHTASQRSSGRERPKSASYELRRHRAAILGNKEAFSRVSPVARGDEPSEGSSGLAPRKVHTPFPIALSANQDGGILDRDVSELNGHKFADSQPSGEEYQYGHV